MITRRLAGVLLALGGCGTPASTTASATPAPPPTDTTCPRGPGTTPTASAAPAGDRCALGLAAPGTDVAQGTRAVTGAPLAVCGTSPLTGFVRDGYCRTGVDDAGAHTVCGAVTAEFLAFSKGRGNDLVTPRGSFPGLVPGDRWCLCEGRVEEARAVGVRVPVVLAATNEAARRTLSPAALAELGTLAR